MVDVPRTQDRMTHDVWLPAEIVELRARARSAVEKRLVPDAREIGSREESRDSCELDEQSLRLARVLRQSGLGRGAAAKAELPAAHGFPRPHPGNDLPPSR
jgi:hypothetical protein